MAFKFNELEVKLKEFSINIYFILKGYIMNDTKTNIIKISGKNIDNFFQNLITNDINHLTSRNQYIPHF